MKRRLVLVFTLLTAISFGSNGQIRGVVEVYSEKTNSKEILSVPLIKVRAFEKEGMIVGVETSNVSGSYHLDVPAGQQVRLEFSDFPEGMVPAKGESAVHFVTAPAEVSLKLFRPAQYLSPDARAVQTIYAQGSLENKSVAKIASLVSYPAFGSDSARYVPISSVSLTGSVWGVAYDRATKMLFSSALAKRHSALGPLGPGGIYVTDVDGKETKPFVSLDALGFKTAPAVLTRELTTEWQKPDHDSLMFSQVGKIGLGGLDISDDSRYLFTVNLYDRHLYRIELKRSNGLPVAGAVQRYAIPEKLGKGGQARPFAVKYHQGQVYVGVVCDAQQSGKAADLMAYVFAVKADGEIGDKPKFRQVASFSLDYPRGAIDYGVKGWFPWTDNYLQAMVSEQPGWMIYPQPILSDIEFDNEGSMIVSLMDRLGHQTGDGQLYRPSANTALMTYRGVAGGDVIRLTKPKRSFEAEENGRSGNRFSVEGQSNGEGPGGGEFYMDDSFTASGITWHRETAAGGLALLSDEDRIMVSVREPGEYVTGGVKWFDNQTGATTQALSVFPGYMQPGYFWKGNNVGDIELMSELPDTEIGDRVWLDNNGDGIQGADEPALSGVAVQLYEGSKLLGAVISDSLGRYRFNDSNLSEAIKSRTTYEIRVPLKQPVGKLVPTAMLQGAPEIDNNAVATDSGYAAIALKTTNPGENVHHADFGFLCNDKPNANVTINCHNNQLQVSLAGTKENQRYDLTPTGNYEGITLYKSAKNIPANGLIAKASLNDEAPYEATVRIYAPSGCYQDVFVNSANQPGCGFISETLALKEPYSIAVYPNPSQGHSRVSYRGGNSEGKVQVRVTDLSGRAISSGTGNLVQGYYHGDVNLAKQPSGTYVITIKEDGRQTTKSILRQ